MKQTSSPAFIIGVICNGFNNEDLAYYDNEFTLIRKLFKDHVKVIFIGNDGESLPAGTEYTKPVSINHYFKHLYALKVDMLFVPLIQNKFNETSENYNKYLEAALFGIPVITVNQYPYNKIIRDKRNGFIYESREVFIDYLKDLLTNNLELVKICGLNAYERYLQNLTYSPENLVELNAAFE